MKKVNFLFGIHCHQPVGNFEHVMDEAYERSYLPFIRVMEAHPRIKFAVHYSGILYDWFMEKHPEFIELLAKLVKRGQVEVITAGYYEPIIPIIPDEDKVGQIGMQNDLIKAKFGAAPRGLWLTERIWEPHLPSALSPTGIEYVTVDDYHFLSAGVSQNDMLGYYVTEEEGCLLKVFPISKMLRYLIPFKLPEETINYLRSIASSDGKNAAVLADDGEKFGVWPGTYKWVYEDGYLEKLLTMLEENSDWIRSMTFSEYLDEYPALGRIYLPTASYAEMMEWSLPTEAGKKLEKILGEIEHQGKFEEYRQFFKGGFFRNFFVKYPEANNMHKKMLQVSQKLATLKKGKSLIGGKETDLRLREAREELFKGQCNCAYWHGVFGGLYLNYLRHAIYEHLIKAETLMDKYARASDNYAEVTVTDFDKDGRDEVILSNNLVNLYFSPSYGGSLFEFDYKPKCFNLINTLARREEVYHDKIRNKASHFSDDGHSAGARTIHELARMKEAGLEQALVYDRHCRFSLLDHFMDKNTDIDSFRLVKYRELGDFTAQPYEFMPRRKGSEVSLVLCRQGKVNGVPVKVEKTISLCARQSIVNISYQVVNLDPREKADLWFGVEFNFSLLAGNAPDRYFVIDDGKPEDHSLAGSGTLENVKSVKIVDDWKAFSVSLQADKPALLWRFPVETVSQSESGFEKTYQSSVVFPSWRFTLEPNGRWATGIALRVEE